MTHNHTGDEDTTPPLQMLQEDNLFSITHRAAVFIRAKQTPPGLWCILTSKIYWSASPSHGTGSMDICIHGIISRLRKVKSYFKEVAPLWPGLDSRTPGLPDDHTQRTTARGSQLLRQGRRKHKNLSVSKGHTRTLFIIHEYSQMGFSTKYQAGWFNPSENDPEYQSNVNSLLIGILREVH